MNKLSHDHKQCLELFAKLSEYIDNELDISTARIISKHLDHCKPCRVCLETLKRTVLLCRSCSGVDLPIPDNLSKRIRALISAK